MTKILIDEATVKLALEALEGMYIQGFTQDDSPINNAITALREALAEQPAQCSPAEDGVCEALDCSNHKPAQQALDKKAENARELGLDYEPAQQDPVAKDNSNYRFDPPGLDPSHQKPVAWWIPKAKQFCLPSSDGTRPFAKAWEPLYTSPPAQRTWVGLTDEDKHYLNEVLNLQGRFPIIDAIEAKLKEKNQ